MTTQVRTLLGRIVLPTMATVSAQIQRVAVTVAFAFLGSAPQLAPASISSTDPDFSIVLFPDTQFYNSQNAYMFKDRRTGL